MTWRIIPTLADPFGVTGADQPSAGGNEFPPPPGLPGAPPGEFTLPVPPVLPGAPPGEGGGGGGGIVIPPPTGIQPVSWWTPKYSLTGENNAGEWRSKSGNASEHYNLAWILDGAVSMFRATNDRRYADMAFAWFENMKATAVPDADILGNGKTGSEWRPKWPRDGLLGWRLKADWGGTKAGAERSLYDWYPFRYFFLLLESTHEDSRFTAAHASLKAFAEKHIWGKWFSRHDAGYGETTWRIVVHITSHIAVSSLVMRRIGSTAAIRSQAQTFLDTFDHGSVPAECDPWKSGLNFHNHFKPHPYGGPSVAYWDWYWANTGTSPPYDTDVSHGAASFVYVFESWLRGYGGFTQADVNSYCALYNQVWPPSWGTAQCYDRLRAPESPLSDAIAIRDGFPRLGVFSAQVQKRNEVMGDARRRDQFIGSGAMCACILHTGRLATPI